MATITVTIERTPGERVTREIAKRSFVIGSGAGSDVIVDGDPEVAAQHLRVIVRRWDGAVVIRALAAPTFVNAGTIEEPVTVAAWDQVRIGARTTVTFAATEVAAAAGGRRWW